MNNESAICDQQLASEPRSTSSLTETQKLWQPIHQLTTAHQLAMKDLNSGSIRGDEVLQKKSGDAIEWIQGELHKAHLAVLEYQRKKSAKRVNHV